MVADVLRIRIFLFLTLLGIHFVSHANAEKSRIENEIGNYFFKALNISEGAIPTALSTSSKQTKDAEEPMDGSMDETDLELRKNDTLVELPETNLNAKERRIESETGNPINKTSNSSEGAGGANTKKNDTKEELPKTSESKGNDATTGPPKTSEKATKVEPTPKEPVVKVTERMNKSTEPPKTNGNVLKVEASSKKPVLKKHKKPKRWYQVFSIFKHGSWLCRWFRNC